MAEHLLAATKRRKKAVQYKISFRVALLVWLWIRPISP